MYYLSHFYEKKILYIFVPNVYIVYYSVTRRWVVITNLIEMDIRINSWVKSAMFVPHSSDPTYKSTYYLAFSRDFSVKFSNTIKFPSTTTFSITGQDH